MKKVHILTTLACLLFFAGCASDDTATDNSTDPVPETPSAIDNKPFKLAEYIDASVHPGDNMYRYSCGKWLDANAPGILMCDYGTAQNAKTAQLTNTPENSHIQDCIADYEDAYLQNQRFVADIEIENQILQAEKEVDEATTMTELAEVWAKYVRMGYIAPTFLTIGSCEKGLCVLPVIFNIDELEASTTAVSPVTRAATGIRCNVIDSLMTALDIDLSLVQYRSEDCLGIIALDYTSLDALKNSLVVELEELRKMTNPIEAYNSVFYRKITHDLTEYARFIDFCEVQTVGLWATQQESETVSRIAEEMKQAFIENIQELDWMSSTTKSRAIEKISSIPTVVVAATDMRGQTTFPSIISGETLVTSYTLLNKAMLSAVLSLCGQPRTQQNLLSATQILMRGINDSNLYERYNASYQPSLNAIVVCPAYGSAPLLDLTQSDAHLYGNLGFILAHELTHSVDVQGARYNKYGESENWWTDNDYQTFLQLAQDVIDSYGSMDAVQDIIPNIKNNGEVTLDENIADIGGMHTALRAYKKHLTRQGFKGEEMDKCLRSMFVANSFFHAETMDAQEAKESIALNDSHSLTATRMGGICRNTDEWYRLFGVEPNHKLYLSPDRRCKIW